MTLYRNTASKDELLELMVLEPALVGPHHRKPMTTGGQASPAGPKACACRLHPKPLGVACPDHRSAAGAEQDVPPARPVCVLAGAPLAEEEKSIVPLLSGLSKPGDVDD